MKQTKTAVACRTAVNIVTKVLAALWELPLSLCPVRHPKLIMTLLVRDEEEMLERNLRFHRAMGVDGFIVTDNNSQDRTPAIIRKYKERGWILEAMTESGTDYSQKRWVDRMVWIAKRRYKADWVINADADEFWYAPSGCLKDSLHRGLGNVLHANSYSVYPEAGLPCTEWGTKVLSVPTPAAYGLPLFSIFSRQRGKVLHRTRGYIQISTGNHKVLMLPRIRKESDITIYHYDFRSYEQFLQKVVNGGRALEQNSSKRRGRHWRYFYGLWKEGRLEDAYGRVLGRHCYDALLRNGYLQADASMATKFEELGIR